MTKTKIVDIAHQFVFGADTFSGKAGLACANTIITALKLGAIVLFVFGILAVVPISWL